MTDAMMSDDRLAEFNAVPRADLTLNQVCELLAGMNAERAALTAEVERVTGERDWLARELVKGWYYGSNPAITPEVAAELVIAAAKEATHE